MTSTEKPVDTSAEAGKFSVTEVIEQHGEADKVPLKYRGTIVDKDDMATMGKNQVLRVSTLIRTINIP